MSGCGRALYLMKYLPCGLWHLCFDCSAPVCLHLWLPAWGNLGQQIKIYKANWILLWGCRAGENQYKHEWPCRLWPISTYPSTVFSDAARMIQNKGLSGLLAAASNVQRARGELHWNLACPPPEYSKLLKTQTGQFPLRPVHDCNILLLL